MTPACRHRKQSYGIIEHQIALEEQLRVAESRRDAAFVAFRPLKELVDYMTKVDRLLKIITELQKLKLSLDSNEKQLLEKHHEWERHQRSVMEVIVPYSKSWNLRFTEKVQSKLSRELRDMIYV